MDGSFTVIGARGYIGSHLCRHLASLGAAVTEIDRFDATGDAGRGLGHVIFAGGITADFRKRPFDTIDAHVSAVAQILQGATFASFLYLSSTRVYQRAASAVEDSDLSLSVTDPQDLYNASKLAGEALCLALPDPGIRVARLSNVYGADDTSENFLTDIVRAAVVDGRVTLRTALTSAKDFVSVADVVAALPRVAVGGRERLYNVASGRNTRFGEIADALRSLTGCTIDVVPGSPAVVFPEISIARLQNEFDVRPTYLADDIADLVADYKIRQGRMG
jgi:nucleoside-diphosphate-sugar epimerase